VDITRSTHLPPDPTSAGAARRFVTTALQDLGEAELVELAELLVSELVTNAVLHAGTAITLEVRKTGDGVRVGVIDASRRGLRQRDYSEVATTGRGLTLVEALASSWGAEPSASGKTVWFELRDEAMAQ
jgi:anti-sigma regulatory factor (Ser/Thr protein kinase)